MIAASREDIAEQLWLRDETELAAAMLDTDDVTHRLVMQVAAKPRIGGFIHNRVDELLAAAAVQVLTGGDRRKPRRWRPRSDEELATFWHQVGPERDHRDPQDQMADILRLLDDA